MILFLLYFITTKKIYLAHTVLIIFLFIRIVQWLLNENKL